MVKAAPAEPTVPPPAGGDEEPPQFDPKKIVPPLVVGTGEGLMAERLSRSSGGKLEVEPGRTLTSEEKKIADVLVSEGHHVVAKAEANQQGVRTADFEVD